MLLAGSEAVATTCASSSGWPTRVDDLLDKVEVEAEQNANVLRITASDEEPARRRGWRMPSPESSWHSGPRATARASRPPSKTCSSSWRSCPLDAPERQDIRDSLQRLASLRALANGDAA